MVHATILPVQSITVDETIQPRATLDSATVSEYAAAISDGAALPPITVYRLPDGTILLADGWHRLSAHQQIGRTEISAEVHEGTLDDAILAAAGANATHGLPRSNADKRRAVLMLLDDVMYGQESDRWIAKAAGVSHTYVARIRAEIPLPKPGYASVGYVPSGEIVRLRPVVGGGGYHITIYCPDDPDDLQSDDSVSYMKRAVLGFAVRIMLGRMLDTGIDGIDWSTDVECEPATSNRHELDRPYWITEYRPTGDDDLDRLEAAVWDGKTAAAQLRADALNEGKSIEYTGEYVIDSAGAEALVDIRDHERYRLLNYSTFEWYLRSRWDCHTDPLTGASLMGGVA
mgnify:CR=1 FL=1